MTIIIYKVIAAEYRSEILKMDRVCFPDDDPPDLKDATAWLAFHGREPVGYALGKPSLQNPSNFYLSRAGVLPPYRGNGIQKRLISRRLRYARSLRFESVVTDTFNNPPSANNLIRSGFRCFTPAVQYGEPGTVYWTKALHMERYA